MHTSNNVFALVALPLLTQAAAAPPTPPTITRLVFSGTGCPNDSNSVKPDSSILADAASVTYSQLKGSSTDNCGVHIQSSGASPGWQVAVRQAEYVGDVVLKGNSGLDTYTQVFWSENAGDTVRLFSLFFFSLFSLPLPIRYLQVHFVLFLFPLLSSFFSSCPPTHRPEEKKKQRLTVYVTRRAFSQADLRLRAPTSETRLRSGVIMRRS